MFGQVGVRPAGAPGAPGAAVTARAPGKVILFGEHAINRGQPALATSVGLYATCRLAASTAGHYHFQSDAPAHRAADASRDDLLALKTEVDGWRAAEAYEPIRRLAAADFFAPAKYVLASALEEALPPALDVAFRSEIPASCGLGSGGAAFAALARAIGEWTGVADRERLADWAHRGDVIAHGGVASRLDTQTSLAGGVIRFLAGGVSGGLGEPVACAPGLSLAIGNTGIVAATAEVNARVRAWLAARPAARRRYFEAIGVLANAALAPLQAGDWPQVGHLMTLNHLLLEKIGVSCPEIERLIAAALDAGALGAKLAGSGGGGIVIALAAPGQAAAVAAAMRRAGGETIIPHLAVPGASVAPGSGRRQATAPEAATRSQ